MPVGFLLCLQSPSTTRPTYWAELNSVLSSYSGWIQIGKIASIVDELVSYGADFEVLDDEEVARSIVVDNIPEEAREEDIIIHF